MLAMFGDIQRKQVAARDFQLSTLYLPVVFGRGPQEQFLGGGLRVQLGLGSEGRNRGPARSAGSHHKQLEAALLH